MTSVDDVDFKPGSNGIDKEHPEDPGETDTFMDSKPQEEKGAKGAAKKAAKRFGLSFKGFLIICVLLLLLLIFFIVVVALAASFPAGPRYSDDQICSTPACLHASAQIQEAIDMSIPPCTDFWGHACKSWIRENPRPNTLGKWGVQEILAKKAGDRVRTLLNVLPHSKDTNTIEWKLQTFYQSCMNLRNIELDGSRPVERIIELLGGWGVLKSFQTFSWDIDAILPRLHAEYGVHPYFRVEVVSDPADPGKNIIQIGPTDLGLPDASYYLKRRDDEVNMAYKQYMKDIVQMMGATAPDAEEFANDIYHYEKRLAYAMPKSEELSDPMLSYNRMTVGDIDALSSTVQWVDLLRKIYPDVGIDESTEVLVRSKRYLKRISEIITASDKGVINNYIMWKLTSTFVPFLSEKYRSIYNSFWKEVSGAQEPMERWEMCVRTTQQYLSYAINGLYADNMENRLLSTELVTAMFDKLRDTIEKNVGYSSDDELNLRAAEKIQSLAVQVGVPYQLLDVKYLTQFYDMLKIHMTDFFRNVQNAIRFQRKLEEKRLSSPTVEDSWWDLLDKTEITYFPTRNLVVVPDTLLEVPLFNPKFPISVLYGSLGTQLSYAMVQSVGESGIKYDRTGVINVKKLQSTSFNESLKHYNESKQCIMNAFKEMRLEKDNVLNRTLTASTMEVAAVQFAYQALENIVEDEEPKVVPALNLDHLSVFFLSYGHSLCYNTTEKQLDVDKTSNDRLVNEQRLTGILRLIPEFSDTFSCYSSSPMYSTHTCDGIL